MCASAMFNSKIMNFEPPINSNLFSTSPNFNSLPNPQFTIDHHMNSLNNDNLLSFNLNSQSPTYQPEDEMKMDFKKKAGKSCRVCGDSAFYFFYGMCSNRKNLKSFFVILISKFELYQNIDFLANQLEN